MTKPRTDMLQVSGSIVVTLGLLCIVLGLLYLAWPSPEESTDSTRHVNPTVRDEPAVPRAATVTLEPTQQGKDDTPVDGGPAVQGAVVDQDGNPVLGVLVRVAALGDDSIEPRLATTREDGAFNITVSLADRTYELRAMRKGYLPVLVEVVVPPEGLHDVRLVLTQSCSIAGQVVDAKDRPVEGVAVSAVSSNAKRLIEMGAFDLSRPANMSNRTDSTGVFLLENLSHGTIGLTVTSPAIREESYGDSFSLLGVDTRIPLVEVNLAEGEQREGVIVRLPAEESDLIIEGVTVDIEGRPVSGASVWSVWGSRGNSPIGQATAPSDDKGWFRINAIGNRYLTVGEGSVIVMAEADGYEISHAPGVLWGTRDLELTLAPASNGRIEGIVLDRGTREPVSDARVSMWQVYTDWGDRRRPNRQEFWERSEYGVPTDQDGRFDLSELPAGEVTLLVVHPDYGVNLHRANIQVSQDTTTNVEILLDSPGKLAINVTPSPTFKHTDRWWCRLEILPLDVLDFEDEQSWAFSYGSAGPVVAPEISAAMRFGHAMTYLGGHKEFSKQDNYEELRYGPYNLAPGTYSVRLRTARPNDRGTPTHMPTQQVRIRVGVTSELHFEIGGGSAIEGHVDCDRKENESVILLLQEAHSVGVLPANHADGLFEHVRATQVYNGGSEIKCVANREGDFQFPSVPQGDYILRAFLFERGTSTAQRLIGEVAISANGHDHYTVDLP